MCAPPSPPGRCLLLVSDVQPSGLCSALHIPTINYTGSVWYCRHFTAKGRLYERYCQGEGEPETCRFPEGPSGHLPTCSSLIETRIPGFSFLLSCWLERVCGCITSALACLLEVHLGGICIACCDCTRVFGIRTSIVEGGREHALLER